MTYIVARHSPKAGLIEPVSANFSAHDCTCGKELGIKPQYDTRQEADADAARLEEYVIGLNPAERDSYMYRGTLVS